VYITNNIDPREEERIYNLTRYDEAIGSIGNAIELDSNYAYSWYTLGTFMILKTIIIKK
jgi:hypothetical protein